MAVTGKFDADFASFFDACQKAEVSLRGFEAGAGKVESSLNRMVDNFSGRKIITEATLMAEAVERVGGTSRLTSAEVERVGRVAAEAAEKLRAWGQDVPPQIQKLADGVKGVTAAGGGFTSFLGTATGLLSAFGVGLSVGALVNFGKALVDDADALTKMHDKTGVSVEGLQAMRIAGDDAGVSLESMTAAVNMLQKRLGSGDDSAVKALQDLGINVQRFKALDGAQQMSAISDAVKEMHDPLRVAADLSALFGKTWAEQLPVLKRGFRELSDGTRQMSSESVKAWDDAGDAAGRYWRSLKANIGEAGADILTLSIASTRALNSEVTALSEAAAKAAPFVKGMVPPGLPADLDAINAKFDKQAKIINDNMTPAMIAFRRAMEEINSVGGNWWTTLDAIDGVTVESVKHYLQAGVAQNTLATAYSLTAGQVRAIASALADELAGAKSLRAFEDDAARREFEIRNLQTKATNDAVLERFKEQQASEAAFSSMQAAALAAIRAEEALNNTVRAVTGSYWAQVDAAAAAAGVTVIGHRPGEGGGINTGGSPNTSTFSLGGPFTLAPPVVSSHKDGGPVKAGPAMLHDNEYVVPSGGALVSRGGGGTTNVTIHVNGTAEDVARKISAEIWRRVGKKVNA